MGPGRYVTNRRSLQYQWWGFVTIERICVHWYNYIPLFEMRFWMKQKRRLEAAECFVYKRIVGRRSGNTVDSSFRLVASSNLVCQPRFGERLTSVAHTVRSGECKYSTHIIVVKMYAM